MPAPLFVSAWNGGLSLMVLQHYGRNADGKTLVAIRVVEPDGKTADITMVAEELAVALYRLLPEADQ